MKSSKSFLFAFIIPLFFHISLAEKSVEQNLSEGNQHLTTGRFNEAIHSFDDAIQQDPSNYVSYYKRATAYLSIGKTNSAIEDFSKILDIKPGFEKALFQRAKLYMNMGDFELARKDLMNHSASDQVKELLESIEQASIASILGQQAFENKEYDNCIQYISQVIQVANQRPQWRLIRAKCHLGKGEIEEAANDYSRVAHLNPGDKDLLMELSSLNYFSLYEPEKAITQIKQCLHSDPEDKSCKKQFRLIKKIEKEIQKTVSLKDQQRHATAFNGLIGTASKPGIVNEIDEPYQQLLQSLNVPNLPKKLHLKMYSLACELSIVQKDEEKAEKWCLATLDIDQDNKEALKQLGEMKLNKNEFEDAVRYLERAFDASGKQDHHIRQLLVRAQQLLKQSKKRDYYKILDVSRDADPRTIKKAYRKLAQQWHPDKYSGDLDKNQVESKMADINQAYEVLSDPEKREQFDNGFDPYDPEAGQQQQYGGNPFGHHPGGNPFAHFAGGGFPFGGGSGGGGSHFTFHF